MKSVGCGVRHTLLLLEGGRVMSCGSNDKGQLGQDKVTTRPGEEERVNVVTRCTPTLYSHTLLL